jgi:hypothetical protein
VGAETLILALAVFYGWYMIAWGANWLDPDRLPVRAPARRADRRRGGRDAEDAGAVGLLARGRSR